MPAGADGALPEVEPEDEPGAVLELEVEPVEPDDEPEVGPDDVEVPEGEDAVPVVPVDVVVLPAEVEGAGVGFDALPEAPAGAKVELELGSAAAELSGAELGVACPLFAFPPQPTAAVSTATRSKPARSKEKRCT